MKVIGVNVGVLVDCLRVGGVEKLALLQARELSLRGHNVTILVMRRGRVPDELEELALGQRIVYLDDAFPRWLRLSVRMPGFAFLALFHFTYPWLVLVWPPANEVDVLMCHNTYTAFCGVPLSKTLDRPLVSIIYDPFSYIWQHVYAVGRFARLLGKVGFMFRRLDRWICHNSHAVCSFSDVHGEKLALFVPQSKVEVLAPGAYPAVDIDGPKNNRFIAVTAWKRGKRAAELIQVFSRLSDLQLDFIGIWLDHKYREEVEMLIQDLRLGDRVRVLGAMSEDELVDAYKNALCAVVVNEEAGFGLSVLDAAAQGCAFIAPSSCGASRCFTHGVEGLFYKYGDLEDLETCIVEFARFPLRAVECGAAGWSGVKQKLTWQAQAEKLENVLLSLVENPRHHRYAKGQNIGAGDYEEDGI